MSMLAAAIAINRKYAGPKTFGVKATTKIWGGGLVAVTTGNVARPATIANTTDRCVGFARETVDNTAGADSALTVKVLTGIFEMAYTGTINAIDEAKRIPLYLVDDQTVSPTQTAGAMFVGFCYRKSSTAGFVWLDIPESYTPVPLGLFPVIAGAIYSWAGGTSTTAAPTVTGVVATDVVVATLVAVAGAELIKTVAPGTDIITFTMSANATNTTTKIAYAVHRANG